MSAVSVHIHAWRCEPVDIKATCHPENEHAPMLVMIADASIHLPHAHALRLVDQLTAALAQHKATHDFHRGAGGAG